MAPLRARKELRCGKTKTHYLTVDETEACMLTLNRKGGQNAATVMSRSSVGNV